MRFKFQSFVDISTSASSMQIIQWSVGGDEVLNRCRHLFGAYKYFKLGKISVKMVPASTLPVDPQGLSYAADDPQTVDPRDQMNPGLVRITNGEDVFTDVSRLTASQQEGMYNSMMLDPRWSKFMLQSGFRRTAYPLYWQIGQLSQDKYPGATDNLPYINAANQISSVDTRIRLDSGNNHSGVDATIWDHSSPRGLFQVGHRGKLGFLPTDYFQQILPASGQALKDVYGVNNVPEVSVITCVLPKAYKTIYYYRVFITEEVIFSGLRSAPAVTGAAQYAGIDQFLLGQFTPLAPGTNILPATNYGNNDGGDLP